MSEKLGPIEIECDAPPYPVVRAGSRVGLVCPEDVRWFRMSRFLANQEGLQDIFRSPFWKLFLGARVGKRACTCGHDLPSLERYTFTFRTGRQASYLIGQCIGCRTVYWEEA